MQIARGVFLYHISLAKVEKGVMTSQLCDTFLRLCVLKAKHDYHNNRLCMCKVKKASVTSIDA